MNASKGCYASLGDGLVRAALRSHDAFSGHERVASAKFTCRRSLGLK